MLQPIVIQIFMAATIISIVVVGVVTVGYPNRISRIETAGRISMCLLATISVGFRYILLLPGDFLYSNYVSVVFDTLYVTILALYIVNTITRKDYYGEERRH